MLITDTAETGQAQLLTYRTPRSKTIEPISRAMLDQFVPSSLVFGPTTQPSPLGSLIHVRAEVLESSMSCRTAMHAVSLHQSLTELKQLAGFVHVAELYIGVVLLA